MGRAALCAAMWAGTGLLGVVGAVVVGVGFGVGVVVVVGWFGSDLKRKWVVEV